jgi:hypothetical protein
MQKDNGRKKMLTNVRSLTFSPSLVEARLSMTPLALKSCGIQLHFLIAWLILKTYAVSECDSFLFQPSQAQSEIVQFLYPFL